MNPFVVLLKDRPMNSCRFSVTMLQRISISFASSCNSCLVASFWGHCQHVVHMHACANISDHINEQTWVSLVLHKTLLFQLSPEVLSSASRRCAQAWQCFPHPPRNLPPVQKILWFPPLRWLSEELLSVSHFSVEKSLRVVSHERFVLFVSHLGPP